MEIKPEDELSNIVLFPVKEDDPRNQVNFLYEPSERPYCHHASVRVDEKERQVRCKICGAVVEPFDWMLSVAKRETRLADDVRLLRQEERERRKNIEKLIQWICPYISRHLLSLNPLLACCRRYSRGER